MAGFKRIEDRPTPKEVYNWRVYMLAIICGEWCCAAWDIEAGVG